MRRGSQRPRCDLLAAQAAAKSSMPEIGNSCVRKALILLGHSNPTVGRKHILKLFKSLGPDDFAHLEQMNRDSGRPLFGDVYGKVDEHGVWFIKFVFDGATNTVIMSCHEAEDALLLANGRTLRKKKEP